MLAGVGNELLRMSGMGRFSKALQVPLNSLTVIAIKCNYGTNLILCIVN